MAHFLAHIAVANIMISFFGGWGGLPAGYFGTARGICINCFVLTFVAMSFSYFCLALTRDRSIPEKVMPPENHDFWKSAAGILRRDATSAVPGFPRGIPIRHNGFCFYIVYGLRPLIWIRSPPAT